MINKSNKIKSLYTLLVASELYSDKNSLFSSLSERYIIYTNGNQKNDNILKEKLKDIGLSNIKIIPINTISNKNEIFNNATICDYFSENVGFEDIAFLKTKLEKGETVMFQLKENKTQLNSNLNLITDNAEEIINENQN